MKHRGTEVAESERSEEEEKIEEKLCGLLLGRSKIAIDVRFGVVPENAIDSAARPDFRFRISPYFLQLKIKKIFKNNGFKGVSAHFHVLLSP